MSHFDLAWSKLNELEKSTRGYLLKTDKATFVLEHISISSLELISETETENKTAEPINQLDDLAGKTIDVNQMMEVWLTTREYLRRTLYLAQRSGFKSAKLNLEDQDLSRWFKKPGLPCVLNGYMNTLQVEANAILEHMRSVVQVESDNIDPHLARIEVTLGNIHYYQIAGKQRETLEVVEPQASDYSWDSSFPSDYESPYHPK